MNRNLKKGVQVEWKTSQGKTSGTIKKKLLQPAKIKTHRIAASKDNPEFLIESDKSVKQAAHKAAALKKK